MQERNRKFIKYYMEPKQKEAKERADVVTETDSAMFDLKTGSGN